MPPVPTLAMLGETIDLPVLTKTWAGGLRLDATDGPFNAGTR